MRRATVRLPAVADDGHKKEIDLSGPTGTRGRMLLPIGNVVVV